VRLYGECHVRAQVRARRWQMPTPLVIIAHNGPPTSLQRIWASWSGSPRGSMLHGLSAAAFDGLIGLEPDTLTLVTPGSARPPRGPRISLPPEWEVEYRWSTELTSADVSSSVAPPRTRLPRSVVDAASQRVPLRRARVIVLAAVQQGLTQPPALWDALSRRGRCRNRAIIAESIVDAIGGVQSLPEHEFDVLCRGLRLPEPARQRVLQRPDGRYFLDNDWPALGIRTEIHGVPHMHVQNWDNDLLRQNDISIEGSGLLVFSSYAIRHVRRRVEEQLLAMFRRRGHAC